MSSKVVERIGRLAGARPSIDGGTDSASGVDADHANAPALLVWAVKASFLNYVAVLSDGLSVVSPEVVLPGEGRFGFPLSAVQKGPRGTCRFDGCVTFRGHCDLLFVSLVELEIERFRRTWHVTGRRPGLEGDRFLVAIASDAQCAPDDRHVPLAVHLSSDGAELLEVDIEPVNRWESSCHGTYLIAKHS